jgi:hypothetical protein
VFRASDVCKFEKTLYQREKSYGKGKKRMEDIRKKPEKLLLHLSRFVRGSGETAHPDSIVT